MGLFEKIKSGLSKTRNQVLKQMDGVFKSFTNTEGVRELLKQVMTEELTFGEGLNLSTKPSIILVIGVNGVGKTTTIGKMAAQLKADGKKVIIAAADTFRAAAIDQLEIWAVRAGVDIISQKEGSDPAAVVYDAIS